MSFSVARADAAPDVLCKTLRLSGQRMDPNAFERSTFRNHNYPHHSEAKSAINCAIKVWAFAKPP